jgi:hypothetical protein
MNKQLKLKGDNKKSYSRYYRPLNLVIVVGVMVSILVAVVVYRDNNHQNDKNTPASARIVVKHKVYSAAFDKLDSYQLSGPNGTTLSFVKPQDMVNQYEDKESFQVGFAKYSGSGNQLPIIGQLNATLGSVTNSFGKDDESKMKSLLRPYINGRLAEPFYEKVNLTNIKKITNGNLSGMGWIADFTVKAKPPADQPTTVATNKEVKVTAFPDLKGQAVFASTPKATLYFMFYDTANDWSANSAAWQKAIDSLKVEN